MAQWGALRDDFELRVGKTFAIMTAEVLKHPEASGDRSNVVKDAVKTTSELGRTASMSQYDRFVGKWREVIEKKSRGKKNPQMVVEEECLVSKRSLHASLTKTVAELESEIKELTKKITESKKRHVHQTDNLKKIADTYEEAYRVVTA
ncbi:hypothetical protein AAMO2058_001587400 [Amorphochlora amoebiformis]|uniref:Uncharacterized protein n=1 Tax=Amorphochlora amoebiformis TaxID=1561963 RepID=A0A7S0DLF1_9EUKA